MQKKIIISANAEQTCVALCEDDVLVEVTPKSFRIRKRWLTENERKRNRDK